MAATKKHETREMFVKTRREWRDGSKVEIEFTSVKKIGDLVTGISQHMVTLYTDGRPDACTCSGFSRWSHCCHIDHFRLVEDLRRRIVVVAEQPVQSIRTVVALLNLKFGKAVISIGVPVEQPKATPVVEVFPVPAPAKPKRDPNAAPLNGNRAFSVLKSA